MKRHLNPCSKVSSSDQREYRGSGWIPDSTLCEAIPDFRILFAASEFPAADHVVVWILEQKTLFRNRSQLFLAGGFAPSRDFDRMAIFRQSW
jgi:hypothetical protein